MLRLTAQYADGWNAWVNQSDNSPGIPALRAAVDAACAAVGRDPATLWRSSAVLVEVNGAVPFTPGTVGWRFWPGRQQTGTAEQLAAASARTPKRGSVTSRSESTRAPLRASSS
jgi:hypothetical protein